LGFTLTQETLIHSGSHGGIFPVRRKPPAR
jgi:hypothetical protein